MRCLVLSYVVLSSNKQYGLGLQVDNSDVVFGSGSESAPIDPNCNTVSLMKSDKRVYRNMIAVSQQFICYTVKGNLLRVIDSAMGEKVLLRGHESPVVDVRFSPADDNVLCSVDSGESDSSNHIHLWHLALNGNVIEQTLQFSLPLKANNVKSHPLSSRLWGISFGNQFGLFHADLDGGAQSYEGLRCCLPFKDDIIDFCFAPDGRYVAVITGTSSHTTIGVFKLTGGDMPLQLQAGNYSLTPSSVVAADPGRVFSGVSFIKSLINGNCSGSECVLVSLSVDGSSGPSKLQVWNLAGSKRTLSQTVSLTIPRTDNLEPCAFPVCSLSIDSSEGKFLTVSSRNSTIVACLGISDDPSCQRLYHCTFLNLKFAVSSVVNSTVHLAEKDGTARLPVPHVEITCFQDQQNGQNAVQQYQVPSKWVFQPPSSIQQRSPVVENNSPISFEEKKMDSSTFLKNVLFSKPPAQQKPVSPPIPEPVVSSNTGSVGGISILAKEDGSHASLPVGSFPDFALISDNTPQTKEVIASHELPPQQVDIGVKSKQILLDALKVRPAAGANTVPIEKSNVEKKPHVAKTKPVAPPIQVPKTAMETKKQQSADDDEDDWEKASISISRSQPSTPLATDSQKMSKSDSSLEIKFNELLAASRRMEEKISSLEEKTIAAEQLRKKAKAADVGNAKALGDMKTEIIQDVVVGIEHVQLQSLGVMVERQSQQAVANILASEKWRQQVMYFY
jgi:hypothetical protein